MPLVTALVEGRQVPQDLGESDPVSLATAKIAADKQRIEARRGKNIAKVAAARKLLTLVY